MSAPVDVLAWFDDYIRRCGVYDDGTPIRAAVAELIDSQRELLALVEQWAVQIEVEWGMCRDLDELEKDGELRPEIIRARTALARIGGAA